MLEVDLVSHNCSFTTLDEIWLTISPIPPTQTNESRARISARRIEVGVWGRMRSPAQNRRRRPLLDTPASTIKKIRKIRKKGSYPQVIHISLKLTDLSVN